jgi:hypothetical protein
VFLCATKKQKNNFMKTPRFMMMLLTCAVTVLTLARCGSDDPIAKKPADVYVAGSFNTLTAPEYNWVPAYWKNGELVMLAETVGEADLIAVKGNDVYVLGDLDDEHTKIMWKNGIETTFFTDDTDHAYFTNVKFIGNDMYVVGTITGSNGDRAAYWKNGVPHTISTPRESRGLDITVDGEDVYVVGRELDVEGMGIAMIWKNDVENKLTDGTGFGTAFGIAIANGDVYVSGEDETTLMMWKNGVATSLGNAGSSGTGTASIAVHKGDVYVSGYEDNEAKIWKNGESTPLPMPEGGVSTYGYNISVSGKDVFVLGEGSVSGNYKVLVWKNGELLTPYDGTNTYSAYSMSVAAHK